MSINIFTKIPLTFLTILYKIIVNNKNKSGNITSRLASDTDLSYIL